MNFHGTAYEKDTNTEEQWNTNYNNNKQKNESKIVLHLKRGGVEFGVCARVHSADHKDPPVFVAQKIRYEPVSCACELALHWISSAIRILVI